MIQRVLCAPLWFITARSPNAQRFLAAGQRATDEQRIQVTEVVGMQVAQEDLIEVIIGDLRGCDALIRSGPDIEEKLVAVPQFEQPT